MEVRSSRQAEVGIIPADWRLSNLSEISAFITKGSTPTTYGFKWVSSGVLFLRSECVAEAGLDLSQSMFISEAAHASLQRSAVRVGDLLVTITGYVGRVVIFRGPDHANINQHIARVRINSSLVCSRFVYHYLSLPQVRSRFNTITTGQAYPQISLKQVRGTEIPLPPTRAEQEAIAEPLSDADALIESLEQLLAKKRQLKQGAMLKLLGGKKRLPGFRGRWGVKRLEELTVIRSGGTPSTRRAQFWDGGIPWCTPTDITALKGQKYLLATERTISRLGLESSSAEIIPSGSVVMTSRATIGECAINRIPVATNQGFKNLVPRESVDVELLYYLLLTQKQGFVRLCGGSTFLEIGKAQLAAFEVRIPLAKDEQTAIATILSDMDAEIAALEARHDKTRDLKQAMMQELLTGKTRLVSVGVTNA